MFEMNDIHLTLKICKPWKQDFTLTCLEERNGRLLFNVEDEARINYGNVFARDIASVLPPNMHSSKLRLVTPHDYMTRKLYTYEDIRDTLIEWLGEEQIDQPEPLSPNAIWVDC